VSAAAFGPGTPKRNEHPGSGNENTTVARALASYQFTLDLTSAWMNTAATGWLLSHPHGGNQVHPDFEKGISN